MFFIFWGSFISEVRFFDRKVIFRLGFGVGKVVGLFFFRISVCRGVYCIG